MLVALGVAWLLGIYLGSLLDLPPWTFPLAIALGVSAAFLPRWASRRTLSLCLTMLALGLWRYTTVRSTLIPGPLSTHHGKSVALRGWVVNDPVPHDRSMELCLLVDELTENGMTIPVHERVLVYAPSYESYRYGETLLVHGKLQAPPEFTDFPYRLYLARQGIHTIVAFPGIQRRGTSNGAYWLSSIYSVRHHVVDAIAAILPEPEASLLTGILLGSDEGIPDAVMSQFRATGAAHVIAISGFNITIIAGAAIRLFNRVVHRYRALLLSIVTLALYCVLAGGGAPVVRAAIMGILTSLALLAGRRAQALTSLFVAAITMTLVQPFVLWDIGFQLSFLASLGLVLVATPLEGQVLTLAARFMNAELAQRVVATVRESLIVSLAAQLATLPLMIYHFHHWSPVSLVANLLITPVQPSIMLLGGAAAAAGSLFLPLGRALGWVAWLPLAYTVRVVEFLSRWANGPKLDLSPYILVGYYGLLALVIGRRSVTVWVSAGLRRLDAYAPKRPAWVLYAPLVALLVIAIVQLPDRCLQVFFLDVGQGDAILIEWPQGQRVLLDGGPSPSALLNALGRRLPFWDRRIDVLLVSHLHDDHIRGLFPLLQRYSVRVIMLPDAESGTPIAEQFMQAVAASGATTMPIEWSHELTFGPHSRMLVLPCGEDGGDAGDEAGLVASLDYGRCRFLFTADQEAGPLLDLLDANWPLSCTVLKVPHHGSATGLNPTVLRRLAPDIAVVSVGADNRFGHPHPDIVSNLEEQGIRVLRTDRHGAVRVSTDGERYWIDTERPE